jgi:hypothetical protein
MLELPLKPLLHIAFVTAWCSVFQSCKPLSLLSFRVIVILFSVFSVGLCVSVFYFFLSVGKFFKTIFLGALALQALLKTLV